MYEKMFYFSIRKRGHMKIKCALHGTSEGNRREVQLVIERQLTPRFRNRLGTFLKLDDSERERFFWEDTRADGSPVSIETRDNDENAFVYAVLIGTF